MITIIFENDDFFIINKPPTINVHNDEHEKGLVSRLKAQLGITELYLVHRLDKMTSGLLLLAKNSAANSRLSQLFAKRDVEKFYLALSDHKPKKKQGLIKGDMEKGRGGSWKLSKTTSNPAISQFFSASIGEGLRLFMVKPTTGKTHQIRVALKSISAPILGDQRYHAVLEGEQPARGYLHAYCLRFSDQGQAYEFVLPPTDGELFQLATVQQQLLEWGKPWQLSWPKV